MEIINLTLSFIGIIVNFIVSILYNKSFVSKYKNFSNSLNNELIKKYKNKFEVIFKNKTAEATKINEEIDNILTEMRKEIIPLEIFNNIGIFTKISIISLSISIITSLLSIRYTNLIVWEYSYYDISYFTLIIGAIFFCLLIYNAFSLNKKISDYQLKG